MSSYLQTISVCYTTMTIDYKTMSITWLQSAKEDEQNQNRNNGPLNIYLDNTPLKQVQELKYLGSVITEDGRMDREIEMRCQKANTLIYQLTPLLTHPNIPMTSKQQLINSIFIPSLCYQCQSWTLTSSSCMIPRTLGASPWSRIFFITRMQTCLQRKKVDYHKTITWSATTKQENP